MMNRILWTVSQGPSSRVDRCSKIRGATNNQTAGHGCRLLGLALLFGTWFSLGSPLTSTGRAAEAFGFARIDITPEQPLRLSGYASRSTPFVGVDTPLYVRACVMREAPDMDYALVTVDTIGLPGALTKSIAERVENRYGLSREQFVIACSHSHTAPQIAGGLTNIFTEELSDDERAAAEAYTRRVADAVVDSVQQAIADVKPGRLYVAQGQVGFAYNRRMLKDGQWVGFGINPDGPVDHSLPVLKITDREGRVRGVLFNYACHCTTFGPSHNRINGDWAGYAAAMIEDQNGGAVALCTIGCGADQNPPRESDMPVAQSRAAGKAIALEVQRLTDGTMREITAELSGAFGFAGLPVDRPDIATLRKIADSTTARVQEVRHARAMLDLHARMGRLPETYPAPIHVWHFGDQLGMVFLGGEVVVDYALRLKRELDFETTWVTAYADDVFAYVASERVRKEGGYEVTRSMIYYNQPGPWAEGTEETVIRRVRELATQGSFAGPRSPEQALQSFHLPEGYRIEIVAAEPLIADPVNFAVGPDRRLWVVEMGDYPRGADDVGSAGGRIKVLTDADRDGRYDQAELFVDGLKYPTGVLPWRDGVLVSSAPDILWLKDTDGDGHCDTREVLVTGFHEANPQHRVNGFTRGLDNWLHIATDGSQGVLTVPRSGRQFSVSGRDIRIQPDSGLVEAVSGRSQFGRNRDDWGHWFGGNNSYPIWHAVIDDRYLQRNPYVTGIDPRVHLLSPARAPEVYPASRTVDRFNDLFALNRFTSACSPMIFRDPLQGEELYGAALISEPVHNLIHRARVIADGESFAGERFAADRASEFIASTDQWCRPTRIATGPDGSVWFADMYRQVIEHPEWIPEAWQSQLNLRAGADRGRIYRVYLADHPLRAIPDLAALPLPELVTMLDHPNGWVRDTAQQRLVASGSQDVVPVLRGLLITAGPLGRVHALSVLDGLSALRPEDVVRALDDEDWRVQRHGVRLAEAFLNEHPEVARAMRDLLEPTADSMPPQLRLQLALSLGEWDSPEAAGALLQLAHGQTLSPFFRQAILSSSGRRAFAMVRAVLTQHSQDETCLGLLPDLFSTALAAETGSAAPLLDLLCGDPQQPVESWQLAAWPRFREALRRRNVSLEQVFAENADRQPAWQAALARMRQRAYGLLANGEASLPERRAAATLLGSSLRDAPRELELASGLLEPQTGPSLQEAFLDAVGQSEAAAVPDVLLKNWTHYSPRLKTRILGVLLSRTAWTQALLDAMQQGRVAPGELDAGVRANLLKHRNAEVRQLAAALLGDTSATPRTAILDEYARVRDLNGNPLRGRMLFGQICATCHRFREQGNEFGPQLATLQDRSTPSLLTAILDPNRAVEARYHAYVAALQDGRLVQGAILDETSTHITFADTTGRQIDVLRVDLDELVSTGKSFMPEGLEKQLTPAQLADVIAYVQSSPGRLPDVATAEQNRRMWENATAGQQITISHGIPAQSSHSWLGPVSLRSQDSSGEPLVTRVAVMSSAPPADSSQATPRAARPATPQHRTVIVRLPVVFEPVGECDLVISCEGRPLTVRITGGDASWNSPDQAVAVRYLALAQEGPHSSGIFEIETSVPAAEGQPEVEIAIDCPEASAERQWGVLVP